MATKHTSTTTTTDASPAVAPNAAPTAPNAPPNAAPMAPNAPAPMAPAGNLPPPAPAGLSPEANTNEAPAPNAPALAPAPAVPAAPVMTPPATPPNPAAAQITQEQSDTQLTEEDRERLHDDGGTGAERMARKSRSSVTGASSSAPRDSHASK